jgi:ribose transport system permease protein
LSGPVEEVCAPQFSARPPPGDRPRRLLRASADDLVVVLFPYALLAVAVAGLAILQPASLTLRYQQNVIELSLVLILTAFGQAPVTMTGGIDLSVPGVLSVVNSIAATQMDTFAHALVVTAIALAIGWVPGAINGFLVVRGRMQPFIVTLATWFIWGGIAFYILPAPGGQVDATLSGLLIGKALGLSGATWILLAVVVFAFWFGRTRLGLSMRAVGSDRVSAGHSGVAIERTQMAAYCLSSWFAVAAGVVLSVQSMSGEPTVGNNYVLPMITAVVVGGVSLLGGKGSLIGPIVGAIVLSYLTGVTFSFRLQPQWNQIFQGFLLVAAISSTHLLQRLARTYRDRGSE